MESSEVDAEIIKAVQADMRSSPAKYIRTWNENNPDHAVPLPQERQNDQPTNDESYKDTDWYREQQRILAGSDDEQPS